MGRWMEKHTVSEELVSQLQVAFRLPSAQHVSSRPNWVCDESDDKIVRHSIEVDKNPNTAQVKL